MLCGSCLRAAASRASHSIPAHLTRRCRIEEPAAASRLRFSAALRPQPLTAQSLNTPVAPPIIKRSRSGAHVLTTSNAVSHFSFSPLPPPPSPLHTHTPHTHNPNPNPRLPPPQPRCVSKRT
ncbi:hypothetical protein L211DRAFT_424393 [Terfezia boudieri ATCC MYA-4762]|uniref:Uncharacterized protein n=1 Tax=Terfezia boudieri ATCC MYA-4762 TaxID=1051890 RepID=A0A3N4LFF5_9PEZI|nr:hypothetical protein L211DRAFT_424393 [Terfezia boudieri ATCC MYA-4762]